MAGRLNLTTPTPSTQVNVYPAATPTVLATLYTTLTGGTSINQSTAPIITDGFGRATVFASPGDYYVTFGVPSDFAEEGYYVTVEEHPNFINVQQALTPAAGALAIDASLGSRVSVAPTGNVTPLTVTNLQAGQRFVLGFTSDGSHTMAYPSTPTPKWAAGAAPTPSAVSGYVDVIEFFYDGTYLREVARCLGQH